MIIRLSQKLAKKIKTAPTRVLPPNANPLADWSSHVFTAARVQYILLSNTSSLYSTVMHGAGITDDNEFLRRGLRRIWEFMADDDLEFLYLRLIAPATGMIYFSKALDRSVTGMMNDLVHHAKYWLVEGDLSPHDVSFRLNEIPMSPFGYMNPRERLKTLQPELEGEIEPG